MMFMCSALPVFVCSLNLLTSVIREDKRLSLLNRHSNGKDFNTANDASHLISYFNYFDFISPYVKRLMKVIYGRRMEKAVACKK